MSSVLSVLIPIVIGMVAVCFLSLVPEPRRRQFNALLIAGAGGAYFNGGCGVWEIVFSVIMIYVAYRGLGSWAFIGVGWLLHTVWDVVHHVKGNPIIPFAEHSSFGCAICDPVIALWCFAGGPSVLKGVRNRWRRPPTKRATPPTVALGKAAK